jgi:hypothetical protein
MEIQTNPNYKKSKKIPPKTAPLENNVPLDTTNFPRICEDEEDFTEELKRMNDQNLEAVQMIRQMHGTCVDKFLFERKMYAKHAKLQEHHPYDKWTHIIMSGEHGGGFVLDGTPECERQFLKEYWKDIICPDNRHYIIERRTPIFKFHVDLDIKRKEPMKDESILTLIKDLTTCIKKFYPPTTSLSRFDCIVFLSSGKGKTGVHAIFPFLYVNTLQAREIRNGYVNFLYSNYGDMIGQQNSWEEIVDESIYLENGFRMAYSYKSIKCVECDSAKRKKNKGEWGETDKSKECSYCHGYGKMDSGKKYDPKYYLFNGTVVPHISKRLEMALEKKDVFNLDCGGIKKWFFELCSIRCVDINEPSSDFIISDETLRMTQLPTKKGKGNKNTTVNNKEDHNPALSPRNTSSRELKTEYGNYRVSEEDYKGMAKHRQKNYISPQSEEFHCVQEYIQSMGFPSYWRQLVVHNMFTNNKKTHYIVNVRGEGQRYCTNNRKGNHNSNSIYFFIDPNAMVQKCYCSCQTTENRKRGKCEDFTSDPLPIPTKLKKLLFPTSNEKLGNFHDERLTLSDIDEYTFHLATTIAKLDDQRKEYLEERRQRLNQTGNKEKNSDDLDIQPSLKIKRRNRGTDATEEKGGGGGRGGHRGGSRGGSRGGNRGGH